MISNWISNNYEWLKLQTSKIKNIEHNDIFQEVVLQFLLMNSGKTLKLINDGEAQKYFMAMYKVNCFSKTSPYQRKYNRVKSVEFREEYLKEDTESYGICIKAFEDMLKEIDILFVDKIIYKEYIYNKMRQANYSVTKMAEESEISKPTLNIKFKNIKEQLKIIRRDEENRND